MSQSTPNNRILLACIGLVALSLVGFGTNKVLQPEMEDAFAPSIAVIMSGTARDFLGDPDGCEYVEYLIYVVNNSTNGESLTNIQIVDDSDPEFGNDLGFKGGDDNNNGVLDPDETWLFSTTISLNQDDFDAGQASNQARVTADVVGQPGISVSDLSDDNEYKEDQPTVTTLDCVSGVAITMTTETKGPLGEIGGCSTIEYTFTVAHQGSAVQSFHTVEVFMENGDSIPGPDSGDGGSQNVLESGEEWVYTTTYPITAADIMAGQVIRNGFVTSELTGDFKTASDISDFENYTENRPTVTDVSFCQPQIALLKTGQLANDCGSVDYEFAVLNLSGNGQTFQNVDITDGSLVMDGPTGDANNDGLLDTNETWIYKASYDLTAADINLGHVDNMATVTADVTGFPGLIASDDSHPTELNSDGITSTDVSPCQPGISIIKTGTVDTNCLNIDYTFSVANEGSSPLTNVVVTDAKVPVPLLPDSGDNNTNGLLDPNEIWIFSASYPITQDDIINENVSNIAQVDAEVDGLPALTVTDLSHPTDTTLDGDTDTDVSSCKPAIAIVKTGTLDETCSNIEYNFEVTNQGPYDLKDVNPTDLSLGLNLAGPSGDDDLDGELDVGEIWTYTAAYNMQQTDFDLGWVSNSARVDANVVDFLGLAVFDLSHPSDVTLDDPTITTLASCVPNISIIKTGVLSGDCMTVDYTFIVENQGNQDLTVDEVKDNSHPELAIAGPIGDLGGDGILSIGETWGYTTSYSIQQTDIDAGFVSNIAQVDAHVVGLPNLVVMDLSHPTETTQDGATNVLLTACQNPKMGLIKEASLADLDQDGCNESIFYRFTVTNTGNISLNNLVLEDELLFNGVVSGPVNGSDDDNDGVLSPNETWIYEAYYGITAQDLANGDVINQANITGWTQDNVQVTDDSDDNSYDENDATLITVDGACEISPPGIGLIKLGYLSDSDGDECPEAIDYTFKVSNRGGEPLANVTISDTFLGTGSTFTMESGDDNGNNTLDLGEEWIYTTSYTLTKTDIEAGKVENQAEVTALSSITQQTVMDISDNNSYEENDPTSTEVIDACDPEGPDSNPINENFEIYTGITPNGDGINDFFRINGIEHYPDNVLKIFNRWGVLVYEAEGYGLGNKLFSGVSEGRATISQQETLPSGTYFYTLEFENLNPGQKTYSGYLYINRD